MWLLFWTKKNALSYPMSEICSVTYFFPGPLEIVRSSTCLLLLVKHAVAFSNAVGLPITDTCVPFLPYPSVSEQ